MGSQVETVQFSDDTTFLRQTTKEITTEEVRKWAAEWFGANHLVNNPDKTQVITFKTKLAQKKRAKI